MPDKKISQLTDEEAIERMGFDSQPNINFGRLFPDLVERCNQALPEYKELNIFSNLGNQGLLEKFVASLSSLCVFSPLRTFSSLIKKEINNYLRTAEAKGVSDNKDIPEITKQYSVLETILNRAVTNVTNLEPEIIRESRELDRICLESEERGTVENYTSDNGPMYVKFFDETLRLYTMIDILLFDDGQHASYNACVQEFVKKFGEKCRGFIKTEKDYNQICNQLLNEIQKNLGTRSPIVTSLEPAADLENIPPEYKEFVRTFVEDGFKDIDNVKEAQQKASIIYVLTKANQIFLNLVRKEHIRIAYEIQENFLKFSKEIRDKEIRELLKEHFLKENASFQRKYLGKCIKNRSLGDYLSSNVQFNSSQYYVYSGNKDIEEHLDNFLSFQKKHLRRFIEKDRVGDYPSPDTQLNDSPNYVYSGNNEIMNHFQTTAEIALDMATNRMFDNPEQYELYFTIIKNSYMYKSDVESKANDLFESKLFAEFVKSLSQKQWKQKYLSMVSDEEKRTILLNKDNLALLEKDENGHCLEFIVKHDDAELKEGAVYLAKYPEVLNQILKLDSRLINELLNTYRKHKSTISPGLLGNLASLSRKSDDLYRKALESARKGEIKTAEFLASVQDFDLTYKDAIIQFAETYSFYSDIFSNLRNEHLSEELRSELEKAGLLEGKRIEEMRRKGESIDRFFKLIGKIDEYKRKTHNIEKLLFGIEDSSLRLGLEAIQSKITSFDGIDLAQFNEGVTDEQYASLIRTLSRLKPRHVRTIAKINSPAGKLFLDIIRYGGETIDSVVKELETNRNIDAVDYLKSVCEQLRLEKKDSIHSRFSSLGRETLGKIQYFIENAYKGNREEWIEVFDEFLQIDSRGKYVYDEIPLRIISLIEREQHELLRFIFSQMKLNIEKESLDTILGVYQSDEEFRQTSLDEIGVKIKKSLQTNGNNGQKQESPEERYHNLKESYAEEKIDLTQLKSEYEKLIPLLRNPPEVEAFAELVNSEKEIRNEFRRKFKRDYESAIRIRNLIRGWMFREKAFESGHYHSGYLVKKIAIKPHESGLVYDAVKLMNGKELKNYREERYQLNKEYSTIKEMIRESHINKNP